jgi:hypothetical protein
MLPVKRYTYECVRCGARFGALSPAMHLLCSGQLVQHCAEVARVVHVEEVDGDAVAALADPGGRRGGDTG